LKTACAVLGVLSLLPLHGQDQKVADSLAQIYAADTVKGVARMDLLRDLAFNEMRDRQQALRYAEELIALASAAGEKRPLYNGYLRKGYSLLMLGEPEQALEHFFKALSAARDIDAAGFEGIAYLAIADLYSMMKNPANATRYYDQAIDLLRKTNDTLELAAALMNAGDFYFFEGDYPRALRLFEESGQIYEKIYYGPGVAYNKGNLGMVLAEMGQDSLARANMNQAIALLEEQEDYYPISVYLTYLADIYQKQGDTEEALRYARRSLDLATRYGLKEQVSDGHKKLSELYAAAGNTPAAFSHYQDHIAARDSLRNLQSVQELADLRTDFEVSQKQAEVDLLSQQQRNQRIVVIATGVSGVLIALIAFSLFRRNKYIRRTNRIIEEEKDRSDQLLRNILPEETARELKESGRVRAQKFESVSILFTDFEGFTGYAESMTPEELVQRVDFYFSKFDEIIDRYGLEKIKTIGDAYMCAGGLPFPSDGHAHQCVEAALEIARFVKESAAAMPGGQGGFNVRIGINTGPVVAGVVGTKKFAYDIWGDAVNIASRMESASEPGKINISENTYQRVKADFPCHYRGELSVKNRGKLKMYFVGEG
jgi:class 3 adenylate cyclase